MYVSHDIHETRAKRITRSYLYKARALTLNL